MTETFDFVFVGAGQNNLSAAAYLAAAGNSVLLLEKHDYAGGGCITQEVTLPGFRHDLHATNIFMAQANPLLKFDELGLKSRFGFSFAKSDGASQGTIFPDGSSMQLYQDLDRTVESIAQFSRADADAYRSFIERSLPYVRLMTFGMFLPPANADSFLAVLNQSAQGRELLSLFNTSAWNLIARLFKDERTRVHLLRLTTELMLVPETPGSAFALLMMAGLYHSYPLGFAIGGAQAFSDALMRCIRHHGGAIETGAEVSRIELQTGRAVAAHTIDGRRFAAKQAVIAGLPPWRLPEFVEGTEAVAEKSDSVRTSDYTCFLTHLALNEPPRPICDSSYHDMGFNTLAEPDSEKVLRITREVAAGKLPRDFSACYVCASNQDPSRAPPGKATLYLYHIAPLRLAHGSADAWDTHKAEFERWLIEGTRRYVPNLSERNILKAVSCSPLDIARESPSYKFGDVAGLGMFPDQFIYGRPIPELAQYRVPGVERLYLCGPFMHPGGGANGGGRAVAMRVMLDLGMDLKRVFIY